jgi:hypothetical protein
MKEIDFKNLFLLALTEPDFSRAEFWARYQAESGYSKGVFWMKLNEWFNHYNKRIKAEIAREKSWGNDVIDFGFSLQSETYGISGHIDLAKLMALGLTMQALAREWYLKDGEPGEQIKKQKKTLRIPLPDVEAYRANLIAANYLTLRGENPKAKPLIAVLLGELAKKYNLPKSTILKQIAPLWGLKSDETKYFTLPPKSTIQKYNHDAASIMKIGNFGTSEN